MLDKMSILKNLSNGFDEGVFFDLLEAVAGRGFSRADRDLSELVGTEGPVGELRQIGVLDVDGDPVPVFLASTDSPLTIHSGRRAHWEMAKRVLKTDRNRAGLFVFAGQNGAWRFSLVYSLALGVKRRWSNYRRSSFLVEPGAPNKTFVTQLKNADFSSFDGLMAAFSMEAVTDRFYGEFKQEFDKLVLAVESVTGARADRDRARDFALLFAIRTIFLGFVQKKGWLADKPDFLRWLWDEYHRTGNDDFYLDVLEPLFFEALKHPHGHRITSPDLTGEIENALADTPYLNGELFNRKRGLDNGLFLPDQAIHDFFDFLFSHNFTIQENDMYDVNLEVNPEFLGIIFERLVNKEDGAVYTPRPVVDMMCRLALVKYLETHDLGAQKDLYELFFREAGFGPDYDDFQKEGDFSRAEISNIIKALQDVTVIDPAAGSGAFEVGMLQVMEEVLDNLHNRYGEDFTGLYEEWPDEPDEARVYLRKRIIARSLFGVEVKEWAVWINHLRLWLTLFVDMPDSWKTSTEPLLPNLEFKVRRGDSLVQVIGNQLYPVTKGKALDNLKNDLRTLQDMKERFFFNDQSVTPQEIRHMEDQVYRKVLGLEIDRKKIALSGLQAVQGDMLGQEEDHSKEIQSIKKQIRAIEDQLDNLHEDRPFIWSVEFPEVFFGKEGFDIVISNPPYVRHQDIHDSLGRMEPEQYKKLLHSQPVLDFEAAFESKRSKRIKIAKRSDLYAFFYIRGLRLLNQKGVKVFVCSNSWLGVDYGAWLQQFMLEYATLHQVMENRVHRSFASADVNTIITVVTPGAPAPEDHKVRFTAFRAPFEQAVLTENMMAAATRDEQFINDYLRVYPISVSKLKQEGSENNRYLGANWGGKYLRAPDVFTNIKVKLIPLSDVAKIIGYVHDNKIGTTFPLVPFIKSIRDARTIIITPELTEKRGVNPNGNALVKADLLFPRTFDNVHLVFWNKNRTVVGKEFYRVIATEISPRILAFILNSTFSILQRELLGFPMGGGALKFNATGVRQFVVPPNFERLKFEGTLCKSFLNREIESIFTECGIDPKSETPIEEQEPNPLPDRKAIDDVVFDAIGLDEDERKAVYRAVCRLVWDRVSKSRSQKKR